MNLMHVREFFEPEKFSAGSFEKRALDLEPKLKAINAPTSYPLDMKR